MYTQERLDYQLCFALPHVVTILENNIIKLLKPTVKDALLESDIKRFTRHSLFVSFAVKKSAFETKQLPFARAIIASSAIFAQRNASKVLSDKLHDLGAVAGIRIYFKDAELVTRDEKDVFWVTFNAYHDLAIDIDYPSDRQKQNIILMEYIDFIR